jgi:WD40 repeat protein
MASTMARFKPGFAHHNDHGGIQVKPMFTHTHSTEGFGLAWSRQVVGTLAVGDCRGKLHTWQPKEGGSWVVSSPFQGHTGSVEDVEWSPSEGTVLATACVDKVRALSAAPFDILDEGPCLWISASCFS